MREKEAREIFANDKLRLWNDQKWWWAKGYLEAIEKADRILEQTIIAFTRGLFSTRNAQMISEQALAKWREEK